jgi:hypothetical protein
LSQEKLIDIFINSLKFDVSEYLIEELTDLQKEIVEDATLIFKDNIVGEIKSFGGNIKKNEEKFNQLIKKAEEELDQDTYKEVKKQLKEYLKKLPEVVLKTCVAIIPVKELPWVNVVFCSTPSIEKGDKFTLIESIIAYYGEIKCFIGRSTIYGKFADQDPLFAPITGNLDLGSYKPDPSEKSPKSHIFPYINAILKSLDSIITKNHLAKYQEQFSRHGDPLCDFLMDNGELLEIMKKVSTSIDSGRTQSSLALSSIALPLPSDKTTLVIVKNESDDQDRFSTCFEALLKLSALLCQAPEQTFSDSVLDSEEQPKIGGTTPVRTPGGLELKSWTAEELAAEAQKRLHAQSDMPTWTEEEIEKFVTERNSGLPEGMEMWTEEQLEELAEKRRADGLNIPEWEDQGLPECKGCGYSLRPGWEKCPVCDTPVTQKAPDQPEKKEQESDEEQGDKEEALKDQNE